MSKTSANVTISVTELWFTRWVAVDSGWKRAQNRGDILKNWVYYRICLLGQWRAFCPAERGHQHSRDWRKVRWWQLHISSPETLNSMVLCGSDAADPSCKDQRSTKGLPEGGSWKKNRGGVRGQDVGTAKIVIWVHCILLWLLMLMNIEFIC